VLQEKIKPRLNIHGVTPKLLQNLEMNTWTGQAQHRSHYWEGPPKEGNSLLDLFSYLQRGSFLAFKDPWLRSFHICHQKKNTVSTLERC
jgi:hypothetical protein